MDPGGMGQWGPRPSHRSVALVTSPLNPGKKKHKFVKAWIQEHVTDPYVQEAVRRGYRSRAAFKLLEIAERDKLLRPGMTAVDLGAAPGSWSQVLRERLGPTSKIVAVDQLPMDGIAGVTFVQADFREDEGLAAVEIALAGRPVDLVVSDMAPNLSGIDPVDQARSIQLGELALEFAISHLRDDGDVLVKVFQGSGLAEFQRSIASHFAKVYVRKPKSSRDRSRETFLVGKAFHGR
jgi:23S rRNA (uridine2552-2'-O)-methyltransferase